MALLDAQCALALFLVGLGFLRHQAAQIGSHLRWMEQRGQIRLEKDSRSRVLFTQILSRSESGADRRLSVESLNVGKSSAEAVVSWGR